VNKQRQKNARLSGPSRSSAHVRLLVDEQYPGNPFVEFESELASLGLEVQTVHRRSMPFMSSQLLGCSMLAILIAYPFFKAFLSEAGKDSYGAAKSWLWVFGKRCFARAYQRVMSCQPEALSLKNIR